MKIAFIFANGDVMDGAAVQRALNRYESPFVAVADGGARVAHHYGLHIDAVIGDMDSIDPDLLKQLKQNGAEVQRHPPEKDFTDLELTLKYVVAQGFEYIRIIGGVGGRLDQTFANVHLLALPELNGLDVRMLAGKQAIFLLHPGEHHIEGAEGDTVSLIPLGNEVSGIHTDGLYYPLQNESLYAGPARGISNVMTGDSAKIATQDGLLLVIHTLGKT